MENCITEAVHLIMEIGRFGCKDSGIVKSDAAPSDKFWALDKRIKEDKRKKGVRIEMNRSDFIYNIVALINEGAISLDDLKEFSDELKETVRFIIER